MIDAAAASQLLDFGTRISDPTRAREQLEGAVAIHNLLQSRKVAYLADEVGMGKTYVALGALALFRHFHPNFRVLIIAPRENIQYKWIKELRNFVSHNCRYPDLRFKAIDGRPVRPLTACDNLLALAHEALLDPNRDVFVRLSSFSLPLSGKENVDPEVAKRLRNELRRLLPWMRDEVFELRNKQAFKDNFARALCCALPTFDLVIVDEGHNLKYGFSQHVAARNRVLANVFGHPSVRADAKLFPNYGPRAKRVLFLSATPVEETYTHLWNQLDVFGLGADYEQLKNTHAEEEEKKALAARFLIRRVTAVRIGTNEYTKNLYRREWREGGLEEHDQPTRVTDPRQRLVVALVQKKVSELLGHARFNCSFQIGMLASFESFLETARLKNSDDVGNFDDADQTDDSALREGIDVADVNRIARSYRKQFGGEMPHPKMDALVKAFSDSWKTGTKNLVFVRRVASVKELKKKLDEQYDRWLLDLLRREIPDSAKERFERCVRQYQELKEAVAGHRTAIESGADARRTDSDQDRGGVDTFFAWFFRGDGPSGVISGANVQQRFVQRGTAYSTFFEDNIVAELLDCAAGRVEEQLLRALGVDRASLRSELRERSKRFLSRAKKPARADRFEAVQAAAVEWLQASPGPWQEGAKIAWQELFLASVRASHASEAPEIEDWLELRTFFTELRRRPDLRHRIWPEPTAKDALSMFRERRLRAQLMATAARLGHAFVDLYLMTIRRIGSLNLRAQETLEEGESDAEDGRIVEYLDLLERQMQTPLAGRRWAAFDELAEISAHFDLILDVNLPDVRSLSLTEAAKHFGQLLRQQQPIGGMSGQINQTLVKQFRMPGYPFALITTDLLQEGEDLHTFCSAVHHYGLSWTPSAMEQRIGRIDRVRSQTDRRLARLEGTLDGADKLQVYFPHLQDTVEILQVQRIFERMNTFLRLMHEGLTTTGPEERTIQTAEEFVRTRRAVPAIREKLVSAFPIRDEHLSGTVTSPAVTADLAQEIGARFRRLIDGRLSDLEVTWDSHLSPGMILGTVRLNMRIQPFMLRLQSLGARPLIRCISPVGVVEPGETQEVVVEFAKRRAIRIGAVIAQEEQTYDLTVEGDVLLANEASDLDRVSGLIRRVTNDADQLEQALLPGRDERLSTFQKDLQGEVFHGR